MIGPSGFGLVQDLEAVHLLAELGVVFLLFNLGLELKIERLRLFGARVYALALTQLLVTAAGIALVVRGLGLPVEQAIIVGGALALSSTAVVLRVVADLGRTLPSSAGSRSRSSWSRTSRSGRCWCWSTRSAAAPARSPRRSRSRSPRRSW